MSARLSLRTLPLALALLAGACSTQPTYRLPEFAVPADYREASPPSQASLPWKTAATGAVAQPAWQIFDLPDLPELLERLDAANASLAVARARYAQAEALIRQSRAGWFPSLSGSAGRTRARSTG